MATKKLDPVEKALRGLVIDLRQERRRLKNELADIERKLENTERLMTVGGYTVPGHPGRRPKAMATPPAVAAHVATQAQAATEQFDAPKAKGGSYKRTAAQKLAAKKRMTAYWADKRAAAQTPANA